MNRVEKAKAEALERFDYILRVSEGRDFVEIVGSIGGDIETYRYYDNGMVCVK